MDNLFRGLNNELIAYQDSNTILINGDSFELLKQCEDNSIDMIFADPPYFLSNGGITCKSGEMVSVNKGKWDENKNFEEVQDFNRAWLKECKRILKKESTIFISGSFHNIYSIGYLLRELNYKILNNITWYKPNASPNLSCRYFTHSTETIIWARKDIKVPHYFNYEQMKEMNNNKQMRDVWEIPTTKKSEKVFGKHPTQKPIKLLERIILAASKEGDVILDPFCGSGTTGVVAKQYNRKFIGIELEQEYIDISKKRITSVTT